jgi:hypothetical protein
LKRGTGGLCQTDLAILLSRFSQVIHGQQKHSEPKPDVSARRVVSNVTVRERKGLSLPPGTPGNRNFTFSVRVGVGFPRPRNGTGTGNEKPKTGTEPGNVRFP